MVAFAIQEKPDFGDTKRWVKRPDVLVFYEHDRSARGDGGKKVRLRFDKARLKRIVDTCNERDRLGQHCPLTLGHTIDNAREEDQPDIAGYARHFRLAYDHDHKKWVVRCTYYLDRDELPRASRLKRSSVEVWRDANFFDPIALLKRTPQLDVGQWTYARNGPADAFVSAAATGRTGRTNGRPSGWSYGRNGDVKLRYALDEIDKDDDGVADVEEGGAPPAIPPDAEEPAADAGPDDVPPDFFAMFMKALQHAASSGAMEKFMSSGVGTAQGGDLPPPGSAGAPAPPLAPPGAGNGGPPPPDRMRRAKEQARFDRYVRDSEDRFSKLEGKVTNLAHKYAAVEAERDEQQIERLLDQMEAEASVVIDRDEERVELYSREFDKREAYAARVIGLRPNPAARDKSRMVNTSGKPLKMAQTGTRKNPRTQVQGGTGGDAKTDWDEGKFKEYMKAHPGKQADAAYAEAVQYMRGDRDLSGELLRGA